MHLWFNLFTMLYTAILRKVVGKSARDNPERYCVWFLVHCFSKKFEIMAREAMDLCLQMLKESNKSWFDSYSVRNRVLIISHNTFRDCCVHSYSGNLSRNNCKHKLKHVLSKKLILSVTSCMEKRFGCTKWCLSILCIQIRFTFMSYSTLMTSIEEKMKHDFWWNYVFLKQQVRLIFLT